MTKVFASSLLAFSASTIPPPRVMCARTASTKDLPEQSYFKLSPQQERYLAYGLAETSSGKRVVGFSQYLFGAGHRGLFSMIHHQVDPIDRIISGGEILVCGSDNHTVNALKANHTSGFIYNLKREKVPSVDNDFDLILPTLFKIDLFNKSAVPQLLPWTEGAPNHLYELDIGNFNLRHDLISVQTCWNFFHPQSNELADQDAIEVYIKSAEIMMPHLYQNMEILIKIMTAHQMEPHLESSAVKTLRSMARDIQSMYFCSTKKFIDYFTHILAHHDDPSDPIIDFQIKLQHFIASTVERMNLPDSRGYDFFELN